MEKKIIQKAGKFFTEEDKHQMIQELLSRQCTKSEIWEKYTGKKHDARSVPCPFPVLASEP